jgi:two-component sensor histidine kinase
MGGPPTAAPLEAGFGTNLLRDLIPHELGGTVDLSFAAEGLCCKIEVPVERL